MQSSGGPAEDTDVGRDGNSKESNQFAKSRMASHGEAFHSMVRNYPVLSRLHYPESKGGLKRQSMGCNS